MGPNKVGNAWPWEFSYFMLGRAVELSLSNTGDVAQIGIPFKQYQVRRIVVRSPNINVAAAFVGVFTDAGGGGTALAANQQLSSCVDNLRGQDLSVSASTVIQTVSALWFRVGTAVAGGLVDVDIFGHVIPDRM